MTLTCLAKLPAELVVVRLFDVPYIGGTLRAPSYLLYLLGGDSWYIS